MCNAVAEPACDNGIFQAVPPDKRVVVTDLWDLPFLEASQLCVLRDRLMETGKRGPFPSCWAVIISLEARLGKAGEVYGEDFELGRQLCEDSKNDGTPVEAGRLLCGIECDHRCNVIDEGA